MLLSAAAQADWRHHRREPLFGRPRFALPGVPRALARGLVAAKQVRRRGVWCCPSRLLRGTPLSPRRRRVSSELYPPAGRSVASRRPFRVAESSASKALKYPSHLLRIAYPKPGRRTSRAPSEHPNKEDDRWRFRWPSSLGCDQCPCARRLFAPRRSAQWSSGRGWTDAPSQDAAVTRLELPTMCRDGPGCPPGPSRPS